MEFLSGIHQPDSQPPRRRTLRFAFGSDWVAASGLRGIDVAVGGLGGAIRSSPITDAATRASIRVSSQ